VSDTRRKVLLADDSATIRRVVELSFLGESIDVAWVADGHAVPAAVERERPDVLLLDSSLPGRDGYDLCAWVQAVGLQGRLPVVVMTGAFETVDRHRLEDLGAAAIVTKPVEPGALVALVHELAASASGAPWPTLSSPLAGVDAAPNLEPANTSDQAAAAPAPAPSLGAGVAPERPLGSRPLQGWSDATGVEAIAEGEFLDQLGAALAAAGYAVPEPDPARAARQSAVAEPLSPRTPVGLAEAFAAVLEAEQQGVPVRAESTRPSVEQWLTSATLDEIARRVAARLADTAVHDMVSTRAAEVAERVARETIARVITPSS
jgi:CheY-like chemotaxis protein